MISNIEGEDLALRIEDFNRRSNVSCRELLELILFFFRIFCSIPCGYLSCIIFFSRCFKYIFIKRYFAITVLLLSASNLTTAIITLSGLKRLIYVIYSLSFFLCSIISLSFKRGAILSACSSEQQHLINPQDLQEVDQAAEDGTEDKKRLLYKALKNLMESKTETETISPERRTLQVPYDFHHSDSYTPLYDCDAGPSHAPDPFPPLDCSYSYDSSGKPSQGSEKFPPQNHDDDVKYSGRTIILSSDPLVKSDATEVISVVSFEDITDLSTLTKFHDDSFNSNEPLHRLSEARISADVIKTFGAPDQVFGADSYKVLDSSDENYASYEPAPSSSSSDVEENTFETSVEVHRSDLHRPLSSNNEGSTSAELALMATDERTPMAVSDLHCNLPYVDADKS